MNNKIKIIIASGVLIIILILLWVFVINKKDYSISNITNTLNECLEIDNICENGTMLNIKVNDTKNYDFYVIDDDGVKLTLLMSINIIDNVSWTSNNTNCKNGPNNLINYIKELTKEWDNIESKEYLIADSNNCYSNILENMRARIPTMKDVSKLGCEYFNENTCPDYLVSNLDESSGYWLSTSNNPIDSSAAYVVSKKKSLNVPWVISNDYYGLRLIIEVNK